MLTAKNFGLKMSGNILFYVVDLPYVGRLPVVHINLSLGVA